MRKNELIRTAEGTYRVLAVKDDLVLWIDCVKLTMPKWVPVSSLPQYESCTETDLCVPSTVEDLDTQQAICVRKRFSVIEAILPHVGDKSLRNHLIAEASTQNGISKRTVTNYLCLYLAYQDPAVLAPKTKSVSKALSQDEKHIRWALNKFYYSRDKHSLSTAYTMMLKEKYCDGSGMLVEKYPTFHQFRYFYRKHNSLQTQYISRDGLKQYQRDHRPLLGDGVSAFAPYIGVGLLDATICDIYLVDDGGKLIGRPILTTCVDAYSGLCCGYTLSWEGGTYSLRGLMLNVIADKTEHCRKFGITLDPNAWSCNALPATLVTDKGSEYVSENFEQITELGVELVNLPSYRPELKGKVEKFFDLIQGYYKTHLKHKGVIEPDFQERGGHDYRKDACLTLTQFETILLHCIIFYNSRRIIEHFPYTEEMLAAQVKPLASEIWNYRKAQDSIHLISVSHENLILTLLPRTTGKFSRTGLQVNGLRYKHDGYTERYLQGGVAVVAYTPEDVSFVWLLENGIFTRFSLINTRFREMNIDRVGEILGEQKALENACSTQNLQARIDLANHIQTVANTTSPSDDTGIQHIWQTRKQEQRRTHRDYTKETTL